MTADSKIAALCRNAYVSVICAILVVPLMLIIPMSFSDSTYLKFPPTKLSWRWYETVVYSPEWIRAALISLLIGVMTMLCATIVGTLAALFIVRSNSKLVTPVQLLTLSPMMVPSMVIAIAIYRVWAQLGMTNSLGGLVVAHTVLAIPLVVVAVSASLRTVNQSLEKAAASLGAGPWSVFWRITFPLIFPGILTGGLFAFVTSFDEIVITMFISGPEAMTVTKKLWDGIRYEVDPSSAVVASIMTLVELVIFCLMIVARGARKTAGI